MSDRRAGIRTFGVGVAAGAAVCAGLTTGVTTGTAGRLVGSAAGWVGSIGALVRPPSAAADELPAFAGCEQLRRWYVDRALPQVGPWGFGGGPIVPVYAQRSIAPTPLAATDAAGAVGSSGTGTNTQEADVDEADIAKTDGRIVIRVIGGQLVVTDVSSGRPREVSRTRLPGPTLDQPELLLRGTRVLVVGDEVTRTPYVLALERGFVPTGPQDARTHLISVDLSDPAAPRVTGEQAVDGGALSTREYPDGTVRVVVTTGPPPLDFVHPTRDRTPRQATRENRRIVRASPISAWLPGIRADGGARTPLLGCSQVRHPRQPSGFGTISVLTFPFDRPESPSATAITAAGDLVYSSAHRLYVATADGAPPVPGVGIAPGVGIVPGVGIHSPDAVPLPTTPTTEVHAFALDGARTTYTASGSIRGLVRDRWSFSEYDGHLRVAAELGLGGGPVDNGVVVLTESGGRLVQTGRVTGLGAGESIESVRWLGDLAIVVTFRQTDPLYTVDLADPAHPRVVGALHLTGYSSYLHPVGGNLLVGVGHDATAGGQDLGAQAATFDLADLRKVHRVGTYAFGPQTDVSVGLDPRTFSYLPEVRTLVTPVQDWANGRSRFVALHVGADGTLTRTASWVTQDYAGDGVRALPLGHGRVALVGDAVRVVDVP